MKRQCVPSSPCEKFNCDAIDTKKKAPEHEKKSNDPNASKRNREIEYVPARERVSKRFRSRAEED